MTRKRGMGISGGRIAALFLLAAFAAGCDRLKELGRTAAAAGTIGKNGARSLSAQDFDAFVRQPGRLVVVDFYADWCGPCRELGPRLETAVRDFGDGVALGKVDVDQAAALAAEYGVRSIPDVRLFLGGRQVDRFVGGISDAEIRALLEKHGAGLPAPEPPAASGQPGPAEPKIQPMSKDWMPPGIERR